MKSKIEKLLKRHAKLEAEIAITHILVLKTAVDFAFYWNKITIEEVNLFIDYIIDQILGIKEHLN